ncbi:uncharacterized protein EDB91DRAFT_592586 [Suillus paluster]|uniref:uncharacterized protein n=1 Tax=Suillus paluster TaxID=48578 RepID=UPI001B87A786|nr:uncharacterized protein EDB91DRAFT_592586 [Suillus paluster]KAG1734260.1 hypothetical protein EDB91DRAFT_592586 [Suillus paluster]
MSACYYGFTSFPCISSIMVNSRSIMFALLSFLAGANACIQCPATLKDDNGNVLTLSNTFPHGHSTSCNYGDQVFCQYNDVSTFWILCSSLFSVDVPVIVSGYRQVGRRVYILSGYTTGEETMLNVM